MSDSHTTKARKTKTENGAVYYEYYFELFKCWINVVNTKASIKKMLEYEEVNIDFAFKGLTFPCGIVTGKHS